MPHDGGRLAVRLDVLSREQLLALTAAGCATDAKLCARADALIAEANPLHRALLCRCPAFTGCAEGGRQPYLNLSVLHRIAVCVAEAVKSQLTY